MTKKRKFFKKFSSPLCLGGLFFVAFLLRAYQFGQIPDVLHVDEAGIGYNAWSLANYGVDRYLNKWPIYPQNYYGGQSPLYTYCLVLLLKLIPVTELTVKLLRAPALISSMFTVVCTAKMLKMIFRDNKITLAGTAFVTFCPYFIMAGRYALDCNMMLSTSVLAITLLIYYIQNPTWSALLWCGGGFALVLYSYALSYLVLPIFLVTFSLYMLYTKKSTVGRLFVLAIEICLLALPLILFVICLIFKLPGFNFLGIQILPTAAARMKELGQKDFLENFIKCIKHTLTNDNNVMDAVNRFYTMYVLSIPFIAVGFIWSLTDVLKSFFSKRFTYSTIFVLYAVAVTFTTGLAGNAHLYRANAIFVCYIYFFIAGLRLILHFLHRYRKAFGAVVCTSYAIWLAAFLRYYFTLYSVADNYPYPNSTYFVPDQTALGRVMESTDAHYVYIDSFFEEYFYFFYPCSPYERDSSNPFGDTREFFTLVNYETPVEQATVYLVRRENSAFIEKLQNSGLPYETEEFEYYYLFMLP